MELPITPYLENLLLERIAAKNKAQSDLDLTLKIIFESKGAEMPKHNFVFEIKDDKLIYFDDLQQRQGQAKND